MECSKCLTILARYEAKIAKICNFWMFRLVIQLIKHLPKIWNNFEKIVSSRNYRQKSPEAAKIASFLASILKMSRSQSQIRFSASKFKLNSSNSKLDQTSYFFSLYCCMQHSLPELDIGCTFQICIQIKIQIWQNVRLTRNLKLVVLTRV